MLPNESWNPSHLFKAERRQLPTCLVAVMWSLGLIEWSQPVIKLDYEAESKPQLPFFATVIGKWKRRLLCVTSRLYLTILVSVYLYCGYTYVKRFFGVTNNFYHFASFLITYWPLMVSVQIISLLTTVCRWFHNSDYSHIDDQWWNVLSESSVSRRLHPFTMSRCIPPKWKSLFLFMSCAFLNVAMLIVHFYLASKNSKNRRGYPHYYVELSASVLSMWYYSTFCYFLYIQRIALEYHFESIVWFVKKNCNCVATCQVKLNGCFKDYLSVRRLVRPWITLVICATTFGLAVHVAWNYKAIGPDEGDGAPTISPFDGNVSVVTLAPSKRNDFFFLDILIFTNKLSVLFMALLAVGGTDINHIWKRCSFILNVMRTSKQEKFWKEMSKMIIELNMDTAGDTILDILLPVLLLALGILGLQNFDF